MDYKYNDWTTFQTLHKNFLNIIAQVDALDIRAMQVGVDSIM